ncbi:MAG: flap endonuclease-1 [Candidatus Aenigmarchaeota archaeon ex4484_56]|nr:MAG: flap endonuclease-1 [Candidatus Aenigmarchaeota archaeon ex4484_56]
MGVNLSAIIEPQKIDFEFLAGKTLAVDSYNIIYQFLSSIRQYDGSPLMDSKGRVTSHLSGLFYRTINLIEKNINLIFVFDGEIPDFKKLEIERRKEIRAEAGEKWKKALEKGDMEEAQKYARMSSSISEEIIEESKLLLNYLGFPVIQGKSEGEAQCAKICRDGKAFATASQDFDSLLFGSPRTLRNLSISKAEYLELIELERLNLSREQLILIGLLIGTDYNQGIKGIGPKKALKLVNKYNTIDKINKYCDFKIPETIYNFFLNPPVFEDYRIEFKKPDIEKIKKLLCDEHDFSEERVEKYLEKLNHKKGVQTNLFGF